MIVVRLEGDHPTVIPGELLAAIGLKPGDEVAIGLAGETIVVAPASRWVDPFANPFATFTEWADELDSAFDDL